MANYHPRSAWQTADNGIYRAPAPRGVRTTWIIHDPGSNGAVPTTFAGQVQYIRNMNSFYRSARGYDLGYSFICFPDGTCFEVRGVDHNNAANAGGKYPGNANDWSCSMMLANPIGTAPTDAQIETACLVMGEFGLNWDVMRHSQVDYTACPSTVDDAVFARLVPRTAPTPTPPPTPSPKGPVMQYLVRHKDYNEVFLLGASPAINVDRGLYDQCKADGIVELPPHDHRAFMLSCARQSMLTEVTRKDGSKEAI